MVGDVFFFEQMAASEVVRSLVGSEVCIRDRLWSFFLSFFFLGGGADNCICYLSSSPFCPYTIVFYRLFALSFIHF